MNERFRMEKGQVLIIRELDGLFFLCWEDSKKHGFQDWPNGDDKILLTDVVMDFFTATKLIQLLQLMLGFEIENITKNYPRCILAVKIV